MNNSLQEQLLKAGLVDKKKAKQVSKEKRKKSKVERRTKDPIVDESKEAIALAKKEKQLKDKTLNAQKQAEALKKALSAQVAQLIQHYRLKDARGEQEYKFKDGTTIKSIRLQANIIDEVIRGRLCIARLKENYEVIPKPVADKIGERDASAIVVANSNLENKTNTKHDNVPDTKEDSDEAYYAQFEIPDDLDW